MKTIIKADTVNVGGRDLPVLGGEQYGAYREMLEALADQLDAILAHHSRVLVFRFDIHQEKYTPDNAHITRFIRRLRKRLKGERFVYLWVRERERAKQQHYHFMVAVDKRTHNNPNKIIGGIIEPLSEQMSLVIHVPESSYYTVNRGDAKSYAEAFKRCSYLCKIRGKGYKAKTANDYGRSRLRLNTLA